MLSCASALRRGSASGEGEQGWWSGNGMCFRVQEGDFWWGCNVECVCALAGVCHHSPLPCVLCWDLSTFLLLRGNVRSGVLRVDVLLVGGVLVSPGRCSCYFTQQDAG